LKRQKEKTVTEDFGAVWKNRVDLHIPQNYTFHIKLRTASICTYKNKFLKTSRRDSNPRSCSDHFATPPTAQGQDLSEKNRFLVNADLQFMDQIWPQNYVICKITRGGHNSISRSSMYQDKGCQIFLSTKYQNGEKYTKLPPTIPNVHKK
jgi:hypothetical protein